MQQKIKAVLRGSRRSKSPSSSSPRQSYESSEASSPRTERHSTPTDGRARESLHHHNGPSIASHSNPPVSAGHYDQHGNGITTLHSSKIHNTRPQPTTSSTTSVDPSIAKDYHAYLPALHHIGQSDSRQHVNGEHHVPDRYNTRKRSSLDSGRDKPLPKAPASFNSTQGRARGPSIGSSGISDLHNGNVQDWRAKQAALLNGVVNLQDTVDVEKETTVAAPVVHEVIKPHEHEIIQHEIHREIHNYSYYHRLQPVLHTEVLPPRHFIPNPNGEGLIEITADELPSRTGENRWWEIMQKQIPQSYEAQSRWRTEPEVIHGKSYITDEGFERKETTIIYPPALEDMTDYEGVVQPVHFDHKTGERWLGEVTTMAKLRDQHEHDALAMKELTESLPEVPDSPSVKRKPIGMAL
ncbi:hypothetical protein IAQ61_005754 [Plenodomus lingam]|uniref:Predicted protein n=1 Tax=Leptosphaeria maculans (strain JN3 / isolate v23.1.3 / race Av1-4-5-6-7-8) TaxID=985895 RepID=E4ZMM6_LEPMJ|nr:predicted protein [Plenodomus lingam JN3]KAH9870281.1 hypothetical protein IAQ61_005754 [Plenodomus lingam]CBX92895.1 predicted protein [Plenodomus lingam JN3]